MNSEEIVMIENKIKEPIKPALLHLHNKETEY